jgi:hypothetical protein
MKTLRKKIENYKENAKFGCVNYDEYDNYTIYVLDDEDGYYTDDRVYDFYQELESFEINIDYFDMRNSDGNSLEFVFNISEWLLYDGC